MDLSGILNFFISYAGLISLVVIAIVITIIGIKSLYFNLVAIFILGWTGESFVGYGLIPDHIPNLLFIYIILIMFIKTLMSGSNRENKIYTPGLLIILSFLSICFLSAIINDTDYWRTFFFIRHLTLFYIFFLCILNTDLEEREIKNINKFLIFLLLIQIPVATIKWLILPHEGHFGQEGFTGTYATHGGGLHTLIPLIAIGFIIPMYINKKRKIYILVFLGFIWFSLIGAKRATLFILPLFVLCVMYMMRYKFKFQFARIILILILLVTTAIFVVRLNPTLNPERKVGGSFDLKYLIDYSMSYMTGKGYVEGKWYASGRFAATATMVNYLINSRLENFLFGYGPGIALKSGLIEDTYHSTFLGFGIEDGITGFVWLSAQIGILGILSVLFFHFYLFKKVLKVYKRQKNPYWRIFIIGTLGTFLVYFFDVLYYSDAFLRTKSLLTIFYYLAAVALISGRKYREELPLTQK